MRYFHLALVPPALALIACGGSNNDSAGQDDAASDGVIDDGGIETTVDSGNPRDATPEGDGDTHASDVSADTGPIGLHVEGNKLVDRGSTVRLLGVNHSGAEYACVGGASGTGYGFYEGPDPSSLADAILTWKANAVRLPINEQCWLGVNVAGSYSGASYRSTITDYVHALRGKGLYVIFDLHWAAPATSVPRGQLPMADADHAPDFWKSAADAFKDDPGVIFDIFNEPFIKTDNAKTSDVWDCLQHGCDINSVTAGGVTYPAYKSAGTQDLVDAIRSTGATNVIMVPGLEWTNDLTEWLAHKPTDPTGNVAASLHLYNFNACADTGCWGSQIEPVSKSVPLITGELGEDDCTPTFINGYMSWADARGISYNGWTWNVWDCKSGPALLQNYDGTPTPFGAGLRDHLKSL